MTLQTERIRTIGQITAFVEANEPVESQPLDRDGAYAFVARTLTRLGFRVYADRSGGGYRIVDVEPEP